MKKKICVFVGSRANYSSIKSVLSAIKNHSKLELQLIVGASAILERYGSVINLIRSDGFVPDAEVYMLIEGDSPATMAKSTALGMLELPLLFEKLKPDIVLTVGDRFETMATTLVAAYMNITIAHTMGGEVSGTIDESIRHAITKFSHIHFPASLDAKNRIIKLGEIPENVHLVGCPRIDLVSEIINKYNKIDENLIFSKGVGNIFSLKDKFLLVSQHPVTTEYGNAEKQITLTLEAIRELNIPAIVLWPNSDAGADDISRGIRKWRENNNSLNMYFIKNLAIKDYVLLMDKTSCLVGNSSSGIREGAFIGTPVVNIGTRQNSRERHINVIDVDYDKSLIKEAILKQIKNGKYEKSKIYGNGDAAKQIAEVLSSSNVKVQKTITY